MSLKKQGELEVKTSKPSEARENACDHVEVGVGFASDWLGEWRQFSGPITKESLAKPMQFPIIVNAQLTIAPTNGTT